jgi:hypothetical protein
MIVIRFRSFRLIVKVSMWGQDGIRHPAPIGTFSLSYKGDILIKFRQAVHFIFDNQANWHNLFGEFICH